MICREGLHTDLLTKASGRQLVRWWNANAAGRFTLRRSPNNSRYWAIFRQCPERRPRGRR